MTVVHASGRAPSSLGQRRHRLARWATALSAVSGVLLAVPIAAIAVAYAVGSADVVEDTWLGYSLGFASFAGLLGSLVACVLGVIAKTWRERGRLAWLSLAVFPAAMTFLVIGEVLWWD